MSAEIPVNSLSRHIDPLHQELVQVSADVLSSGHYVLGPNVKAFEQEFAAYCGVAECVSVANGTEALELGLRSLGICPGKTVAVVANAAMYGTTAVLSCGAEPIFVDIDPVTHTMSPHALEKILSAPRHIDVVIVTHLYGQLADMEAIQALSSQYGFAIFEDCAQAHGARNAAGEKAGSFGRAASFSFYPTKNLGTLGDGGAITTNDGDLASRLRQLRQYGWTSKYRNELAGGRNSRLDELQAAFLRRMLPLLDGWNARRRKIATRYSTEISNPKITPPPAGGEDFVAHLFVIKTENRDDFQRHLAASGIGSDIHYPIPDHRQLLFGDRFDSLQIPVTENACEQIVTLPCFPELTDEEITRVVDACNRW